ncbi:MAG: amidase family protein, partial [Janthinobacterium lividum]
MIDRRAFLQRCATAGLADTLLPGALAALAMQSATAQVAAATPALSSEPAISSFPAITPEMLDAAAAIAGITLTAEQKAMMLDGVREQRAGLQPIRDLHLPNSVAPAMVFDPLPDGYTMPPRAIAIGPGTSADWGHEPTPLDDRLAFGTVADISLAIRERTLKSLDLTKFYLARLKRYDPQLKFVINLTEERALAQAAQADREIAAGHYRGPLHGIPWGAKDLLNVKGYPTTWGAGGMEHQTFDENATVVQRLDAAGAVLVAKLSLGAL